MTPTESTGAAHEPLVKLFKQIENLAHLAWTDTKNIRWLFEQIEVKAIAGQAHVAALKPSEGQPTDEVRDVYEAIIADIQEVWSPETLVATELIIKGIRKFAALRGHAMQAGSQPAAPSEGGTEPPAEKQELEEKSEIISKCFAVVYSNYFPSEIDSLWRTQAEAEMRCKELDGPWNAVEMKIQGVAGSTRQAPEDGK